MPEQASKVSGLILDDAVAHFFVAAELCLHSRLGELPAVKHMGRGQLHRTRSSPLGPDVPRAPDEVVDDPLAMKWGMLASTCQELLLYADLPQHSRRLTLEAQIASATEWVPSEPAWLGGYDDPEDGPLWADALSSLTADSPIVETLARSAAPASHTFPGQGLQGWQGAF